MDDPVSTDPEHTPAAEADQVDTPTTATPENGGDDPVETAAAALAALGDDIPDGSEDDTDPETPGEAEGEGEDGAKPDDEADAVAKAAEGGDEGNQDEQKGGNAYIPDDQFKKLAPNVRDRIRHLDRLSRDRTAERDEARQEIERLTPARERVEAIDSFMDQFGVTPDDHIKLLQFGALMKTGQFEEADAILRPFVDMIDEATGRRLPDDLQKAVDEGDMSEAAARRVAADRGKSKGAEARHALDQQRQQREAEARQKDQEAQGAQQAQAAIHDAAKAAVIEVQAKHPTLDLQQVAQEMTRLRQELGFTVTTPEQAAGLARTAATNVASRAALPGRRSTLPRPGQQTSHRQAQRDTDTVMDAGVRALEAIGTS